MSRVGDATARASSAGRGDRLAHGTRHAARPRFPLQSTPEGRPDCIYGHNGGRRNRFGVPFDAALLARAQPTVVRSGCKMDAWTTSSSGEGGTYGPAMGMGGDHGAPKGRRVGRTAASSTGTTILLFSQSHKCGPGRFKNRDQSACEAGIFRPIRKKSGPGRASQAGSPNGAGGPQTPSRLYDLPPKGVNEQHT